MCEDSKDSTYSVIWIPVTPQFLKDVPSCQWDGFRGAFAVLDVVQKQHTTTTMNNNDDWNNKITIFFNFTQPL
jgi:hypothetical protein